MQLNFSGELYDYYMPALEPATREYAGLVGHSGVQVTDLEKWKNADLAGSVYCIFFIIIILYTSYDV